MNLENKKKLAAKTLNVGINRIALNFENASEIKEAITRQDIHDLVKSGVIKIKDKKGRRKIEKRGRRKIGKIRKKIKGRKKEYVIITRKLRKYVKNLKEIGKIEKEEYKKLRKSIKSKSFKSKRQLKESLS